MNTTTGLLLRLLGPLLEVVCLVLLFAFPAAEVAGLPLRYILYGGIGLGLAMVVAGLTLVRRGRPARRRPSKDDLDNP
jgi:hypothetical protein